MTARGNSEVLSMPSNRDSASSSNCTSAIADGTTARRLAAIAPESQ